VIEWLQDWLGGIAIAVTIGVSGWLKALASKVSRHDTALAVLDVKVDDIPTGLRAIKDEIVNLRNDSKARAEKLYNHMDKMRLEVKQDLSQKADK